MVRLPLLSSLASLLSICAAQPQERYLVSPAGEVLPIAPGEDSRALIEKLMRRTGPAATPICGDKFHFGPDPVSYSTNSNFGADHRDVIGQWLTAKASGTIDSIFWMQWNWIGAYDSLVYVRVHESLVGREYGPGVRPGPFQPGCQSWGYWINSNDPEVGIAAFPDDATDTAWVSTTEHSLIPSTPPIGRERWGYGGFPKEVTPQTINHVAMSATGDTLSVTAGDNLFFSIEVAGCDGDSATCSGVDPAVRTEFGAVGFRVSGGDEDYPSRMWKFYHDIQSRPSSYCTADLSPAGWYARWGLSGDTLDVALFNLWYSMTVITNIPPRIEDPAPIARTMFDGAPAYIDALVTDCDPSNPAMAGVANVTLIQEIDGVLQPEIAMTYLGADLWETEYSPPPGPASVVYRIRAVDLAGAESTSKPRTISIAPFGRRWYGIDTALTCVERDLSANGVAIDTAEFFDPLAPGTVDGDDGIAGPFDLGGPMTLFGEQYRYAWVSVDGAIGLGKTVTDTIKIDRNSMWESFLNISATPTSPGIAYPVIAPMWDNLMVGDTAGQYGIIRYGDDGDPCAFIVQWDSMGIAPFGWLGVPGEFTFRVVLNRCLGTVEFQYPSTGGFGSDSLSVVGMQADPFSTPEYSRNVLVNRMGFPIETRPRNGWCVRFSPRNPEPERDGWNIVSLPVMPDNGDDSAVNLFPGGPVYEYVFDYNHVNDSLRPGRGYWMKKLQAGVDGAPGTFFDSVTVPVRDKWNLIGGTSGFVPTGSIIPAGAGIASRFFAFGAAGYEPASTLEPGRGYWVKMDGAGTLQLQSSIAIPKVFPWNGLDGMAGASGLEGVDRAAALSITDGLGRRQSLYVSGGSVPPETCAMFELPPVPPGGLFDARFESGSILEIMTPDAPSDSSGRAIVIRSAAPPVTIHWELTDPDQPPAWIALEIIQNGRLTLHPLDRSGAATIRQPERAAIRIIPASGAIVPAAFALSSNYPNPFNPQTTFDYALPSASRVRITVFNLAGEEVESLLEGEQSAGVHAVRWDAAGFPSGVYYCRMTAGSFRAVRKMLLIK